MRHISFRGFYECNGPYHIIIDGKETQGKWVLGELLTVDNQPCIISNEATYHNVDKIECPEFYFVNPATVGQGLSLSS